MSRQGVSLFREARTEWPDGSITLTASFQTHSGELSVRYQKPNTVQGEPNTLHGEPNTVQEEPNTLQGEPNTLNEEPNTPQR